MKPQLEKVRHDYIRYANCWEDADILLDALDIRPGDHVLSIGSAGDNSFSMLVNNPELVVAVDINPVQLNLIALKKAAFLTLTYREFLQFLGFEHTTNRLELFSKVKAELPEDLIEFWSERTDEIESGIIDQGKFEKYFATFQQKILPLIHTQKRIRKLFQPKGAEAQKKFHQSSWSNLRWRLLFKIFFSKFVMGKFGRDPQFLKEVKVPVSTFILNQSKTHLSSINCQNNYFLQYILTGKFKTALPHYARLENFDRIKANLNRLEIYHGLAEDAFKQYSTFNKFNLSNIFEYMPTDLFQSVTNNLVENGRSLSRYAYWNLMVPRRMSEISDQLNYDAKNAQRLHQRDKGFFYGDFIIDVKI